MARILRKFLDDERGLETIEYAIIGALITLGTMATIGIIAGLISMKFDDMANKLESAPK